LTVIAEHVTGKPARSEAPLRETLANLRIAERAALLLLLRRQRRRDNVKQHGGHAGIGEMRRDARAHRARAQDGHFSNVGQEKPRKGMRTLKEGLCGSSRGRVKPPQARR
jgi:hypothetical protein